MTIFRRREGSTAVEFALIAPLLILLYAALIETSLLAGDYQRVALASEAGAQAALTDGATDATVYDAAFAVMGKSDPAGFSVTVQCLEGGGWRYRDGTVAVEVSYVFQPLSGFGFSGEWPLTAASYRTARYRGLCSLW